jgi:hypothetical protein
VEGEETITPPIKHWSFVSDFTDVPDAGGEVHHALQSWPERLDSRFAITLQGDEAAQRRLLVENDRRTPLIWLKQHRSVEFVTGSSQRH